MMKITQSDSFKMSDNAGPSAYTDQLKDLYHKSRKGAIDELPEANKEDTDGEDRKSKHVIISEDIEEESTVETTALRRSSENSDSILENSLVSDGYLTLPGTIKRGKKKVQNVEVILNMSREELEVLEANLTGGDKKFRCRDGTKNGIHILFWSFICLPISFIVSSIYSFYIGTITWYNVFTLYSEQKPLAYKIVLPPILILTYPIFIVMCSIGLGVFAGFRQISWRWESWQKEFRDFEKGFFGWFCNALDLTECSPYEVVVLSGIRGT